MAGGLRDPFDVGEPRYCPACAAPLMPVEYDSEESGVMERRCSRCARPALACPCQPVAEYIALHKVHTTECLRENPAEMATVKIGNRDAGCICTGLQVYVRLDDVEVTSIP